MMIHAIPLSCFMVIEVIMEQLELELVIYIGRYRL